MLRKRHRASRAVLSFGHAVAAGWTLGTACDADALWGQALSNQILRRRNIGSTHHRFIQWRRSFASLGPRSRCSRFACGVRQPTAWTTRAAVALTLQRSRLADQIAGAWIAAQAQDRRIRPRRRRRFRAVHTESASDNQQDRQTQSPVGRRECGSEAHLLAATFSLLVPLPSCAFSVARSVASCCCACCMYSLTALPVRSASLAFRPASTSR